VVAAQEERELRFTLTAVGDEPVSVAVEVVLTAGGIPLEVAQLEPTDVLHAAAALRVLAQQSQEHHQAGRAPDTSS